MDSVTARLLITAGKAFLGALVVTPVIRDISRAYNLVDRPAGRKVHAYPVPRVGGIAIAAGIAFALSSELAAGGAMASFAFAVLPAAALVFLVGLLDDILNLPARWKLLGIVVAAFVAFWRGVRVEGIGGFELPLWLSFLATVFWLVLTTNALNLIDGLDGLCGGMGLISCLALCGAGLLNGSLPLAFSTLPLAGALAGFLVYNTNPATVFMGDSGALLTGFLLGCFGLSWSQKSATILSMAAPLLLLAIPLADASLAVVRRKINGRPVFSADRGHIHHRMLDQGFSPRRAVLILYLVSTVAAAMALMIHSVASLAAQGVVLALFLVALGVGVQRLRYSEFAMLLRLTPWGRGGLRALEQARNGDEWWAALEREAPAADFAVIRWRTGSSTREWRSPVEAREVWREQLNLGPGNVVEFAGASAKSAYTQRLLDAAGRTGGGLKDLLRAEMKSAGAA